MSRVTKASFPTAELTKNQIYAFANALVKAGIIDKGGVEHNVDLIELSLKLSLGPEGLSMVLYTSTPLTNSELVVTKPAADGKTGQTITKPVKDPRSYENIHSAIQVHKERAGKQTKGT
jgi:hypothetical protein